MNGGDKLMSISRAIVYVATDSASNKRKIVHLLDRADFTAVCVSLSELLQRKIDVSFQNVSAVILDLSDIKVDFNFLHELNWILEKNICPIFVEPKTENINWEEFDDESFFKFSLKQTSNELKWLISHSKLLQNYNKLKGECRNSIFAVQKITQLLESSTEQVDFQKAVCGIVSVALNGKAQIESLRGKFVNNSLHISDSSSLKVLKPYIHCRDSLKAVEPYETSVQVPAHCSILVMFDDGLKGLYLSVSFEQRKLLSNMEVNLIGMAAIFFRLLYLQVAMKQAM